MTIGLGFDELQKLFDKEFKSRLGSASSQFSAASDGESPNLKKELTELATSPIATFGDIGIYLGIATRAMLEVIARNNEAIERSLISRL